MTPAGPTGPEPFEPRFDVFQKDVERYLMYLGNVEKGKDGQRVFRGYEEALARMFHLYLARGSLAPLVTHLRRWNWEYTYDDRLLDLTSALEERRDWPGLRRLWDAVIQKRRKLHSDLSKIRERDPDAVSAEKVGEARDRLMETLGRVRALSRAMGADEDTARYSATMERIEQRRE